MSETWKLMQEYLDKNTDMKFVIKYSSNDTDLPPHGRYEMWLTKLDEKNTTRFVVHGDNMFDAMDTNILALLDMAKFYLD